MIIRPSSAFYRNSQSSIAVVDFGRGTLAGCFSEFFDPTAETFEGRSLSFRVDQRSAQAMQVERGTVLGIDHRFYGVVAVKPMSFQVLSLSLKELEMTETMILSGGFNLGVGNQGIVVQNPLPAIADRVIHLVSLELTLAQTPELWQHMNLADFGLEDFSYLRPGDVAFRPIFSAPYGGMETQQFRGTVELGDTTYYFCNPTFQVVPETLSDEQQVVSLSLPVNLSFGSYGVPPCWGVQIENALGQMDFDLFKLSVWAVVQLVTLDRS